MAKSTQAKEPILNPNGLPVPPDEWGFTSKMKREAVRAIGRVGSNKAKQDVILETLAVFTQYAKDRYADSVARAKVEAETRTRREADKAEWLKQERQHAADRIRADAGALIAKADLIDGGTTE